MKQDLCSVTKLKDKLESEYNPSVNGLNPLA